MSITELSKNELRALWEAGVPLDSAWVEFAKFFDRFALMALRTHPNNDPDVLDLDHPRIKDLSKGWLPKSWEGRQKKLAITTRNERTCLLGEIYSGRLWAIGFRTLASGFDEPVRIPRQLFFVNEGATPEIHPDIDWDKEALRAGDNSCFDIRIVEPPVPDSESVEASQPQPTIEQPDVAPALPPKLANAFKTKTRRMGRPGSRGEIHDKVKELLSDAAFRAIPHRIDQAREVRARLCGEAARHRDDMPNYRSTFIQRIIGEVANQPEQSE